MKSGKPEFGFRNEIRLKHLHKQNSNLFSFSFLSRKSHKNYQMSGKINSHICLMLSVYKSFHQIVKNFQQTNHICDQLWQKQVEVADDKTAEMRLNTIQV